MTVDIQHLFEHSLPNVLARHVEEARAIRATFQLKIDGGGDWFLDLTPSGPRVEAGEQPADCTLSLSADDFRKLYENPAAAMQLFFAGRLKISGNPMIGMKLQKLFAFR